MLGRVVGGHGGGPIEDAGVGVGVGTVPGFGGGDAEEGPHADRYKVAAACGKAERARRGMRDET